MYYVITMDGVKKSKNLRFLNKKLNIDLEKYEMKRIGNDYIIKVNAENLEFLEDKKKIAEIPIRKLFKADRKEIVLYFMLFLQFVILIKGCVA